jgi:ribulose-5-phosphate 4-epimerase/fuculose-1-phosphate aldolase
MAVSALECGLLPLTQTAMRFLDIGYHDYEGVAIDLDERARFIKDLGSRDAMIMRNHGLLVASASIAQAFNAMYWLEMACKAQVDAMACNTPLHVPSEEVARKTWHLYRPEVRRPFGEMEWPAMLRLVDKVSPGYER